MDRDRSPPTIHASCVLVGEAGILIRGPSGSGKSSLARALVAEARHAGRFAALVADDRVRLMARHGRLIAEVPEAIAGAIEIRGIGIVNVDFERTCVVRLVVDCEPEYPERMPAEADTKDTLCGVFLPRLRLCGTAAKAPDILELLMNGHAFRHLIDDEMMNC